MEGVSYERERLELPDGDFVDLDWSLAWGGTLAVVLHGLESSAGRPYMKGMAKALNAFGWDVLALNFRGCGGEANRLPRFYHSGDTRDLKTVLEHVAGRAGHRRLFAVGFSLGANVLLKFLGEEGAEARKTFGMEKAAAVSVPCDLASAAETLDGPGAALYRKRFLIKLKRKLIAKAESHPGVFDLEGLSGIRTLREYDDRFTAPLHGFRDASDYYARSSSKPHLNSIRVPTLIVNAWDDPFLGPACYPSDRGAGGPGNPVRWEIPRRGGHVGFSGLGPGPFWHERRIGDFFNEPV